MTFIEAQKLLKSNNQEHILSFYDELQHEEQSTFLKQI